MNKVKWLSLEEKINQKHFQFILLISLISACAAAPQGQVYAADDLPPQPYGYQYGVEDEESKASFQKSESRVILNEEIISYNYTSLGCQGNSSWSICDRPSRWPYSNNKVHCWSYPRLCSWGDLLWKCYLPSSPAWPTCSFWGCSLCTSRIPWLGT